MRCAPRASNGPNHLGVALPQAPGPVGGGSSPTGGGGMTRTGSSGSIDFGQRTGSADDLTGMVPGERTA